MNIFPVTENILDSHVDFKISIPNDFRTDGPFYVRVCSKIPPSTLSFNHGDNARQIYAYSINLNQMRNAPRDSTFNHSERCIIRSAYVIHIFPSSFMPSFTDRKAFGGIRMLESDRYNKYVEGIEALKQTVHQDEYVVAFNKIRAEAPGQSTEFTFFTVIEKDIIGKKQWCFNALGAFVGAILGCLLSLGIDFIRNMVSPSCKDPVQKSEHATKSAVPIQDEIHDNCTSLN